MTRVAIAIGAAIAAVVIVGALFIVYDDLSAPPIIIADPVLDGVIVVQIAGAVATPGTYELGSGARVVDVIARAGGTRPDADLGSVNQARRVRDEDQLLIPSRPRPTSNAGSLPAGATDGAEQSQAINLNTASVADLDALTGIGPAIAQRIIDFRTEQGPFRAVDELDRVSGISAAMVEEIRALVTVGE
ncbi:MAG: ComEA family DNA-binding protein [Chloroflexota bacterium]|nr:ComEA family DNA-binding protein [Chloroflexota bacterium]